MPVNFNDTIRERADGTLGDTEPGESSESSEQTVVRPRIV